MRERIAEALKTAEASGDPARLTTLRLMSAAVRDRDLAIRAEEGGAVASNADILRLLRKMVQQRTDSAKAYEEDGRLDLAERERHEAGVIAEFLPAPLTAAEIDEAVAEAIQETKASGVKDLGRVMTLIKSRYPERIDYGVAGAKVLAALS